MTLRKAWIASIARVENPRISAKRMKVSHVVLSLGVGGLERNVINQVREGQALGQAVSVICVEEPGMLAEKVETLGGQLFSLRKPPGIRLSLFRRLRKILRDLCPDIVHTHQIGTLFYAGPVVASLGSVRTRVVHTEHGREPYTNSARRRWLGRLAGHYAERFFCLTHDMAAELIAQRIVPRSKVRVIDNGIDIDRFRERGDPDAAPVPRDSSRFPGHRQHRPSRRRQAPGCVDSIVR